MKRIDIVFFDAGGGHRSAATALKSVAEQQGRDWEIRLIHLQELLAPLDIFRKLTHINMEDVYNKLLANGWTWGSEYLIAPMHALIRVYHQGQVRMLREHWTANKPDLVVSVVPNFNRSMLQALRLVDPKIPYCTIITDFADYPPNFWIEKQEQNIVCGTEKAVEQARASGYPDERIFPVSGMILRPSFYVPQTHDRTAERKKLGLDPDRPTGLVLFGGHGSSVMKLIAQRLQKTHRDLQLIFICGRNEKLANSLRSVKTKLPFHVVGFTAEVPYYMSLSDFFIGKPGPGSISEALAMHLPVIIERNSWTLPQERYNAEWVEEKQVGIVVPNFTDVVQAVDRLLEPTAFDHYRANARAIQNRAVFEILDILDEL